MFIYKPEDAKDVDVSDLLIVFTVYNIYCTFAFLKAEM